MPIINPIFDPLAPFDRLKGYWWATTNRVVYEPDPVPYGPALYGLAGGAFVGRIEEGDAQPMDLATTDLFQVVIVRGSDDVTDFLGEILQSALATVPPWPGRVSAYFAARTGEMKDAVLPRLVGPWLASGHSLGGALCALAAGWEETRPQMLVDFGSPRSGDAGYAAAQNRPRCRITNQTDPIPLVPILDGLTVPLLPWPGARPGYQHWGTRVHCWADTSITRPRGQDWVFGGLGEYLMEIARGEAAGAAHSSAEYARRIRGGIPVAFPTAGDPDYPGLEVLDALNVAINEANGVEWEAAGGTAPPDAFLFPTCS